jgi:hypothetical protein
MLSDIYAHVMCLLCGLCCCSLAAWDQSCCSPVATGSWRGGGSGDGSEYSLMFLGRLINYVNLLFQFIFFSKLTV